MSNKSEGSAFEKELAQILSAYGYWVHLMAQNVNGQPFDLLAAKNRRVYPIDCKVCSNNVFLFSRVEENQRLSMEKWKHDYGLTGWFALQFSHGEIAFLSYDMIVHRSKSGKSISWKEVVMNGFSFSEWVALNDMVYHEDHY